VFGSLGVDPHNPKVVRGSMGAIFRLTISIADPEATAAAAAAAGVPMLGLTAEGAALPKARFEPPLALVVGNERHGLGGWQSGCQRLVSIPMRGGAESLSAAVAGSIALYQASLAESCQDSILREKSQDYRRKKSHGTIRRR
jgi:tRNA G18 (ribose-2'-O)-methylase SpoU